MAFTVQSDVPIPTERKGNKKYPFASMAVGDSFTATIDRMSSIRAAANQWRARNHPDRAFIVRTVSETECTCWRTA